MNQPRDDVESNQSRGANPWRRIRAIILAGVVIFVILPAITAMFLVVRFDPNRYAPMIIAAVDQATGRQMTLGGPITMQLSLTPVIEASNINLSNPSGFADPDLLTLSRVEAKIALIPLMSHRLNILKLVLVDPKIVLEPDKTGVADWDFSFPRTNSRPATVAPSSAQNGGRGYKIALQAVEIQNGLLIIKDTKTNTTTISLPKLTGTADSLASPLHLTANAVLGTTPFIVSGVVGPVERFSGVGNGPWPVNLTIQLDGATATVLGAINHPRMARGYDLSVNLNIPALETVAKNLPANLLGGLALPPIHDINASARIVDQNSTIPAIDNLSVKAGASDLSSLRPGLALSTLDIGMASLDQPLSINAAGKIDNTPITLTGKFGAPQALLKPALLPSNMPPQGSFPISIMAKLGNAELSVSGAIATPEMLAGAAIALNATIPDLSALSPLAGNNLPAWKNIAAQTTLIDPGGLGLHNAAGLDGLAVTMDNATFGGAASLYFGIQPRLQLALKFSQVNADALWAAIPPASAPAAAPLAPAAPSRSASVIPDTPLPLKTLKTASADIQVSADTLVWNQATYTALQGHAVLANGVLTFNPVTGELPGGSVTANATLDATKEPATESLKVNAAALALAPLLKAFGFPNTAEGTIQAQVSATGAGDSPHAIAASLNGQLGLAMVNGVVDGAVMDRLFGTVLRTVGLPANLAGAQGPVTVRCMALRVDAANGIGTIRTLTMDSSRLLLQGGGNVDFGKETLGIVLRPQMQIAGTGVGIPVEIGGSFAAPTTAAAPQEAVQAAGKNALGLPVSPAQEVLGDSSFLGKVASTLGIGNGGDACPAALSLGRLGQSGAAAPPTTKTDSPTVPATGGPENLLNSLLGK
jgi:uncharacterized protein involved in outer membrane biogenesis